MWDDRIDVLYEKEDTALQKQQHTLLNKQIQEQFDKGIDGLPQHAANLMKKDSPEEVKRKTKLQKITWLNTVEKSRKKTQ